MPVGVQVIRPALLAAGFQLVDEKGLEVTDDVSIIEALGKPVKVTLGTYSNIKVCRISPILHVPSFDTCIPGLVPGGGMEFGSTHDEFC